ncbi:hypothetical protein M1D47_01930 [Bacillus sp. R1-10]
MELLFTNTISAFFAVDFLISCDVFLVIINMDLSFISYYRWIIFSSTFIFFFGHSYINRKMKYKLETKHVTAKISKMFNQVFGAIL